VSVIWNRNSRSITGAASPQRSVVGLPLARRIGPKFDAFMPPEQG